MSLSPNTAESFDWLAVVSPIATMLSIAMFSAPIPEMRAFERQRHVQQRPFLPTLTLVLNCAIWLIVSKKKKLEKEQVLYTLHVNKHSSSGILVWLAHIHSASDADQRIRSPVLAVLRLSVSAIRRNQRARQKSSAARRCWRTGRRRPCRQCDRPRCRDAARRSLGLGLLNCGLCFAVGAVGAHCQSALSRLALVSVCARFDALRLALDRIWLLGTRRQHLRAQFHCLSPLGLAARALCNVFQFVCCEQQTRSS